MSDKTQEQGAAPKPECRSLRGDKSTWHQYEPVDPHHGYRGDYVERCVKCGKERTVEVVS